MLMFEVDAAIQMLREHFGFEISVAIGPGAGATDDEAAWVQLRGVLWSGLPEGWPGNEIIFWVGRDTRSSFVVDRKQFATGVQIDHSRRTIELRSSAVCIQIEIGDPAIRSALELDTTFAGAFKLEACEPADAPRDRTFWYPGERRSDEQNGLLVRVEPDTGDRWVGVFADGQFPATARSWAIALPDRQSFAVVSNGDGYIVRADDPSRWETIGYGVSQPPVVIPQMNLVLFPWFTSIVAWGPDGQAWETDTTIYDDLEIKAVIGSRLLITGSEPPGTTRSYTVDLHTGETTAGETVGPGSR
jgi:hypothetical protein